MCEQRLFCLLWPRLKKLNYSGFWVPLMPLKILIAENHDAWRKTAKEALDDKFETIEAKTPDEAKLVINNNPMLAAIVLDGRLDNDDEPDDISGWQVAQEARSNGLARAPIIMYSRFEPTDATPAQVSNQPSTERLPRISHLIKSRDTDDLLAKILDEIRTNLRENHLEDIPRYHQPPILAYSANNGIEAIARELQKNGVTAEILSLEDLQTATTVYPSALFAVNVADEASLKVIERLHKAADIPDQDFYIVALTSDDKFREQVSQAGVDATVVRQSPEGDALELSLLMSRFKIEMQESLARKRLKQGAPHQYQQLLEQLKDSQREVSSALDIVERALNWPFLTANEKLILVSLHTRLLRAGKSELDAETRALCVEAALMLAHTQATDSAVQDWIERAAGQSADFTFAWIDDDTLSGESHEDE
jgi:CheY-like chemotaxis protein